MYRTTSYAKDTWDVFWYEKNLQGDIVAVYNSSGTKLVSYNYTDAWGNHSISYSNGGASTGAQYNPFRYRGYYYDTDLYMYYLQSRYYDAKICRFISADGYVSTGQGDLGAILAEHGMATPAPTVPNMTVNNPQVEFTWIERNSSGCLNARKFKVNFYDENYNLIGSTEPQVVSFDNTSHKGTITVDSQLWQTVLSYPSSIYVSITMYELNGNINNSIYNEHTTSFESPYAACSIPVHVHSYTHNYVKNNSSNHKAYCICGEYILESHFFVSGLVYPSCRDCGYITTGNVPIIKPTMVNTGKEMYGYLPSESESTTTYNSKKQNH